MNSVKGPEDQGLSRESIEKTRDEKKDASTSIISRANTSERREEAKNSDASSSLSTLIVTNAALQITVFIMKVGFKGAPQITSQEYVSHILTRS